MPERLAFEQFHDDKGAPFVLADIVDRANVGMVQSGGGARLTLEALEGALVVEFVGQEFECDAAAEASVFGLVYDAHPTDAELAADAVVSDGTAAHAIARRHQG